MKPLASHALADAIPLPTGRGERNRHLRNAALLCAKTDDRAIARFVFTAHRRYREGAWRREALLDHVPAERLGTIDEHMFRALKAHDRSIGFSQVRRILGHLK